MKTPVLIPRKMVDCRMRFLTEEMRNDDVDLLATTAPFLTLLQADKAYYQKD